MIQKWLETTKEMETMTNKVYIHRDDIASWVEHEANEYTSKWYNKLSKEEFLDGIGNTIYSKLNQLIENQDND